VGLERNGRCRELAVIDGERRLAIAASNAERTSQSRPNTPRADGKSSSAKSDARKCDGTVLTR
jgi:hypothetical protein